MRNKDKPDSDRSENFGNWKLEILSWLVSTQAIFQSLCVLICVYCRLHKN
jgi:hypothetical protein